MMDEYNIHLVNISIIIAIVASYSALSITKKITSASTKRKLLWLTTGSIVMGAGIWVMHFVGMIAHHSHAAVRYEIDMTIISMIISIAFSYIAFYFTLLKRTKWYHITIGGSVMGLGIVLMHYLGMEAMIIEGIVIYDLPLLVLSVIIGLFASNIALFLFVKNKSKCLSAIIMGAAVSGMHYTGMSATTIELIETHSHTFDEINTSLLVSVMIAISTIMIILWVTTLFDRYALEKMAYKDHITGLANRNEVTRFFNEADPNKEISLLFIDLDQFKAVNDTLGHEMGDLLLKETGQLLKKFEDQFSRAFRIGGDEFLFVLDHSDLNRAEDMAKKLLSQLEQPFCIRGHELYITGSIGIAVNSVEHDDHSNLLRAADTAMYVAKQRGRNQYCIYTEEMGVKEVRKLKLGKDLQQALVKEQFYLVYQPKWNVKTGRLFGLEALARWQHPEYGVISPSEFIPIAEETGLIVPFTSWTLEQACKHCKILHEQEIVQTVSINLSPNLFQTGRLYELINDALIKFDLEPHYLKLEITESIMLQNIDDVILQLNKISTLGINISMDNFGTGYSSIGLLDILPISAIKLDRAFIKDINKPSKQAIIRAIIILADSRGFDVIAEGVELEEEINYLTELGCYIIQGYYFSKPMEIKKITSWILQKQE